MQNFDVLQGLFWSVTYILIIVYNVKNRNTNIPPIAIFINFAWEINALLQDITVEGTAIFIHIAWCGLDTAIVGSYLLLCKPVYFKKIFLMPIFLLGLLSFTVAFRHPNGMLITSFFIDFTMEMEYLLYSFSSRSKQMKVDITALSIGVTKLIGDLCAWIFYREYHLFVNLIGVMILMINYIYLRRILHLKCCKKQQ